MTPEEKKEKQRMAARKYRLAHPEKIKEIRKKSRLKNYDKERKRCREWQIKNAKKVSEYYKKQREKNRDKLNAYTQEWRKNNPDRVKESGKQWRKANSERRKQNWRTWREANLFYDTERRKRWRESNYEKVLFLNHLYRARRKKSLGAFSLTDWREIKKKYYYTCPACGRNEPEIKLTIDHIVPLAKGGKHDKNNIQPLCKNCNSQKSIYTKKWNPNGQMELVLGGN